MDILGLVFSDIQNKETFEVTGDRTIASLPVGGRYRFIDFTLSNLTNAGVKNVGIVTKNNYQSLMGHVGSGKEWDLSRKNGGLAILPPYSVNAETYTTRLNAIKGIMSYIKHSRDEYVILTDCYHISSIDFKKVINFHIEHNADITMIYKEIDANDQEYFPITKLSINKDNRVTKMEIIKDGNEKVNSSLDIWLMKKSLLEQLVEEAMKTNYSSFNRDLLAKNVKNLNICAYEHKGYFGNVWDLKSFYNVNMDLLNDKVRNDLFNTPGKPIYTKVRDSAPTFYSISSKVENSLIADGCIIEGEVYNSVLFRGTKVKKGAVVKNSILFQDTTIGENIKIDYVITDKNAKIKTKKELIGSKSDLIYVKKDCEL